MLCFGTPVWADRIRRGGDAGMAGGSLLVAIGEQGLNSLAVAVSFGDDGTLVGGLFAGELGAAGGAGGSAKLGTKAGAAALGTKALAEACVDLSLSARALLSPVSSPGRPSRAGVSSVSHSRSCERARFAQRGQRCDGRARVAGPWPPALAIDTNLNKAMGAGSARSKLLWTVQTSSLLQEL